MARRNVASCRYAGGAMRLCIRSGCGTEAVATLTYDYADSMVVVGPLADARDPHGDEPAAVSVVTVTERSEIDGWLRAVVKAYDVRGIVVQTLIDEVVAALAA